MVFFARPNVLRIISPENTVVPFPLLAQGYGGDIVRSPVSSLGRSHRWSETAQGSVAPLVNSIPRSVWVPCRDDSNGSKLVNFVLPAWAGLRRSWGCLSYSEISWGKDTRGRELAAAGAMSLSPKVSSCGA